MSGTLFVCGLPIGNEKDISQRAIEILNSVAKIAAEDTRSAALLLKKWGVSKPLIAYHDHSGPAQKEKLLSLLKAGQDIALISEAGMPLISDPGYQLIATALRENITIRAVPGPTALTTALVLSGQPSDKFCFEGFLSSRPSERKKRLSELAEESRTLIFYEAPHRITETLQDILDIMGNRACFLGRELTKKYEEHYRGAVAEVLQRIEQFPPRGELVLVLAGHKGPCRRQEAADYAELIAALRHKGLSDKDIIAVLSEGLRLNKNMLKKHVF